MDSSIDVSQWISQPLSKAYPYAKVKECNGRYKANNQLLFDQLYEVGILSDSHLASAEFLYSLHEVATNKTGMSIMRMLVHERSTSAGIAGMCPSTMIKLIKCAMMPDAWEIVWGVCTKRHLCISVNTPSYTRLLIRNAFDNLGMAIEKAIDEMNVRLSNV